MKSTSGFFIKNYKNLPADRDLTQGPIMKSMLLGLCMGSGAFFSICFGQKNENKLKEGMCAAFLMISALTILLTALVFILLNRIFHIYRTELWCKKARTHPEWAEGCYPDFFCILYCCIFADLSLCPSVDDIVY